MQYNKNNPTTTQSVKIKVGLQNTLKLTHLDTRGGRIKSMNSYRLHDQR